MTPYEISEAKGAGDLFTFSYDYVDVAQTFVFDSSDWGLYTATNVDASDALRPSLEDDGLTSLAGSWTCSITLFHLDTFSSAHVEWEGSGFTVEYTLDGTTWTALALHGMIPLSGDPDFDIRVNFAGGVESDTAALTSLTVHVLQTDKLFPSRGERFGVFTTDPITDEGIVLKTGKLDIAADANPDTPRSVGTVEFWARLDSINGAWNSVIQWAGGTLAEIGFDNTGALYKDVNTPVVIIDGAAVVNTANYYLDGEFHHFVLAKTPVNSQIVLGAYLAGTNSSNMTVSHLAFYPQQMTLAEAQDLYAAQNPTPYRVDDSTGITLTESSPATDIYAYSWSVVSS